MASAGIGAQVREVKLSCKPPELLVASAKGTVPVLVLPEAKPPQQIDESLAIMQWALSANDPDDWLLCGQREGQARMDALVASCDGPFKHHLDRFKYPKRYPGADQEVHRQAGLELLRDWSDRLAAASRGSDPVGWLLGGRSCLADWALLPFVRQFRLADAAGFDATPDLAPLQAWLNRFLQGPELATVLAEPWAPRQPWPSPSWLYHLALPEEWSAAQAQGEYRRSSRGLSLEQVGFIHASYAHQLAPTHRRFYADVPRVLLLTLDPQRLEAAGVAVRPEAAPGSQELFPHLFGPLPLAAVVAVASWQPPAVSEAPVP